MPINIVSPPVADYSSAQIPAQALADYPVAGVMRYAARGRTDVNITAPEYANLAAANVPVGITCELAATFMTDGRNAGHSYAQGALDVTRSAGIPDGVTGYAVDFDAPSGLMPQLLDTLTGCADVTGWDQVGVYADYTVIDWLTQNSPVLWYWQTSSWSWGRIHPAASMIQDRYWTQANPITIGGGPVDLSTVRGDWRPRNQEDPMSQADIDAINAHTDRRVADLATVLAARLDRIDSADKQLAGGITAVYGPQKPDGTGPIDPTHKGVGDLYRLIQTLPAGMATAVTAAIEEHTPNVTLDEAALEATVKAAVAEAIDAHLSGATITLTPKTA